MTAIVKRNTVRARALLWLTIAAFAAVSWIQAQEAEPPAAESAVETAAGKAVVGKIDSDIGLAESAYVKRLIEAATLADADLLLIELNTFGGRVDAAVLIRDALLDAPMTTAVFINKRAISAGALISLACEKIVISSGATLGAATPITSTPGQEIPQPVQEKYLSYFRQEMRVTAETRGRNGDLAEAMVDAEFEVPGISEKGKLLTLTTATALEHGFADFEAGSVEEALEKLDFHGEQVDLERSWSESLVGFLTSQAVSSVLFLAMMALAYLEYQTPGFGAFGLGAVACFLLLYFSHYLVDLAGWEELLLFVLGIVLVMIEVLVLPGFGVIGITGLVAMAASAVLLLMAGDWSDFSFENPFTREAMVRVAVLALLSIGLSVFMLRYVSLSSANPLGRRLVLDQRLDTAAGYTSHEAIESLVGASGVAVTPLRPAGKARLAGKRREVETEGDFVAKGAEVRVVRHEPGRIVVRRA
jgi:membrane-bound serine protease (ClpP class)